MKVYLAVIGTICVSAALNRLIPEGNWMALLALFWGAICLSRIID